MSIARYIVDDVFAGLEQIDDDSVDLVVTSPPFLALRSYLPADHPDKAREIGAEPTPADYLDVLLDVVDALDRVLAPHGSIVFEIGDTYSGSGGAGGDYNAGGFRDGQAKFSGSAKKRRVAGVGDDYRPARTGRRGLGSRYERGTDLNPDWRNEPGWPLAKSLTGIPHLFMLSLTYGRNILRPERETEPWRVRNYMPWCLDGDTVVYARTPKGEGPTRLLHLTQNWQPGQWDLWDGDRWTSVLGWSDREADDAIEIEFRNGERISATREHEWPTQRGLIRTENLRVGDVVPHVRLPEPDRAEPEHLPANNVGWLIGTFLADGSFDSRDRIQISGHTDESPVRLGRLRLLAEAFDGTATSHDYGNEGTVVVRSDVLAAVIRRYIGGDGARNKHLRAAAWRRGNDFLTGLLTGYLDGDGHYEAKNDRWRVGFTDNPWLARDLRVLCARLGVSCRIKRVGRPPDPRGGQFANTARFMHHGSIRLTPNPRAKSDGEIVALRASRRRRFFDVSVDGEPHLFALGSGLLTHNCRPNPPVGALGDKFRPATSYITVACKSSKRWFDLDAVRTPHAEHTLKYDGGTRPHYGERGGQGTVTEMEPGAKSNPNGAPPLDYIVLPTAPYWTPDGLIVPPPSEEGTFHQVRVPVDADGGDIRRTTSPDCPVHGSSDRSGSTPDDDEHGGGTSSRTERSDSHPEPLQHRDSVPTPLTTEQSESSHDPATSDPAATRRSTPSNRTAPARSTSPVGTPSARSTGRTGDRSESPSLFAPDPDIDENRTSPDGSVDSPSNQTTDRTVDTEPEPGSSEACTCSHYIEVDVAQDSSPYAGIPPDFLVLPTTAYRGAHYATFGPKLVTLFVEPMCPRRVCVTCGTPRERIVHRTRPVDPDDSQRVKHAEGERPAPGRQDRAPEVGWEIDRETVGWSDCGHDNWRPGIVLDPFAGSGTTLQVATGHGRDAVGIDIDERNRDLARDRIGMFLVDE